MNEARPVALTHGAESMKLLPPHGFPPTKPPSYGVVTQGAVALVEAERPDVRRSFCLATSATDFPPSRPSSWSGALDQVAAGSMPGDAVNGVPASEAAEAAGARRDRQRVRRHDGGRRAVAAARRSRAELERADDRRLYAERAAAGAAPGLGARGARQPSQPLQPRIAVAPDDLTPIKPEVLFEAGNMLSDATGFCGWHPAVSLLAPGSDVVAEPLVPFWATSAAVGRGRELRRALAGRAAGPLAGDAPGADGGFGAVAAADPQAADRARRALEDWAPRPRSSRSCARWATASPTSSARSFGAQRRHADR